jgi:hypothetical protein
MSLNCSWKVVESWARTLIAGVSRVAPISDSNGNVRPGPKLARRKNGSRRTTIPHEERLSSLARQGFSHALLDRMNAFNLRKWVADQVIGSSRNQLCEDTDEFASWTCDGAAQPENDMIG